MKRHLIWRFLANLLGLWLAAHLVSDLHINGSWQGYVITGLVLALLNLLIKPILRVVTFPLLIATLGLFGLVINASILKLTAWLAPQYLQIDSWLALLAATIVITAVNVVSHWF